MLGLCFGLGAEGQEESAVIQACGWYLDSRPGPPKPGKPGFSGGDHCNGIKVKNLLGLSATADYGAHLQLTFCPPVKIRWSKNEQIWQREGVH